MYDVWWDRKVHDELTFFMYRRCEGKEENRKKKLLVVLASICVMCGPKAGVSKGTFQDAVNPSPSPSPCRPNAPASLPHPTSWPPLRIPPAR
jgi:hypothetical protein